MFNRMVVSVTDDINRNFAASSDKQKNTTILWFFVFGSVSLFFAISVIPTYSYVTHRQQEILRLFATFDPEKIQGMMLNIESCENILFSSGVTIANEKEKLKQIKKKDGVKKNSKKKKNISSTKSLTIPYVKLTSIIMCAFFLLQLQPFVDYYLSTDFLKACSARYDLVGNNFPLIKRKES